MHVGRHHRACRSKQAEILSLHSEWLDQSTPMVRTFSHDVASSPAPTHMDPWPASISF